VPHNSSPSWNRVILSATARRVLPCRSRGRERDASEGLKRALERVRRDRRCGSALTLAELVDEYRQYRHELSPTALKCAIPTSGNRLGRPCTGTSGGVSSTCKRGNQSSQLGRFQFQRPSRCIVAGRRTDQMIVASITSAAATPKPSSWRR